MVQLKGHRSVGGMRASIYNAMPVEGSAAAYQHSCTDIYNCLIKAKRVEFDLVRKYELESDGKPKRIHYTLILSKQVPFTSRVLRYCTRTLYEIPGATQKILADLCYNVNNYTFGQ